MRVPICFFIFITPTALLYAQTQNWSQAPSAIELKRVPPNADPTSLPSLLRQYVFEAQLASPGATVPKDYHPVADLPLTSTALEAVQVSERWRTEKNPPSPGPDGRVLYSLGAGLPTVVCAPLRVCVIELQPGEKMLGEPNVGDSVRWNISPAMYGTGSDQTQIIVLKPQTPGLDTNLLITTDRRAYYIRLISKPDEYVARVAFSYRDDEDRHKWDQQIAAQRAALSRTSRTSSRPRGLKEFLKPRRV